MKSQVDHKVLGNFFDYDQTELDFSEVTHNVGNHDKDYCIDIILKYFRKYGFPYYTVTEDEKHKHMKQLSKFDTEDIPLYIFNDCRILFIDILPSSCFTHQS